MNSASDEMPVTGLSFAQMHRRLVSISVLVLIGSCTLEGPLRLLFVRLHAESLLYIRDALAVASIAGYFFTTRSFSRLKLGLVGLILTLLASAFYSSTTGTQIAAIAMGLKVFVPVLLGAVFIQEFTEENPLPPKLIILGLALTVLGLQWSAVASTPWAGIDYDVAGQTVEGTRAWTIEGIDRLAGFARSSGDASNLILVFYVAIITTRRRWFSWFILTGASAWGLYYTTMRSAFLGLLAAAAISFALRVPKAGRLAKAVVMCAVALAITAPWLGRLFIGQHAVGGGGGRVSSSSMMMRVQDVWPDLINRFHNTADYIFGLGLGNVGVPQKLFYPAIFNPADNLGLYALAVFGVSSYLLHLLLTWRVARSSNLVQGGTEALFLGLTGTVYAVGIALNGFESIPLGLAIGMMFGLAIRSQETEQEAYYA